MRVRDTDAVEPACVGAEEAERDDADKDFEAEEEEADEVEELPPVMLRPGAPADRLHVVQPRKNRNRSAVHDDQHKVQHLPCVVRVELVALLPEPALFAEPTEEPGHAAVLRVAECQRRSVCHARRPPCLYFCKQGLFPGRLQKVIKQFFVGCPVGGHIHNQIFAGCTVGHIRLTVHPLTAAAFP
eukprot:3713982-Rhodomonas_salina.1